MKSHHFRVVDGQQVDCEPSEAEYLELRLPGPSGHICLPVITKGTRAGTHCWSWNGDNELPTLKPSVLLTRPDSRCHSFINDGKVQFLDDCSHELANSTHCLLDL